MNKLINAPFPRLGGKSRSRKKVLKMFPPINSYNVYVEPFVGATNIILNAPIVKTMIGADSDTLLINILNDIKKVSTEDIKKFNFRGSRKKFNEIKENFSKSKDPKIRLYQYLYLSYNSFSGSQTIFATGKLSTGKQFLKNIELIKEKYKHIKFIKSDFIDTINKYDSPTTFFYLDPPYYNTHVDDYETGNIDHLLLAETLRNIKGKFLLSHNDIPYIRRLYKGFKFKTLKVQQPLKSNTEFVKEIFPNRNHPFI
jgi:DNA adenine methylase